MDTKTHGILPCVFFAQNSSGTKIEWFFEIEQNKYKMVTNKYIHISKVPYLPLNSQFSE